MTTWILENDPHNHILIFSKLQESFVFTIIYIRNHKVIDLFYNNLGIIDPERVSSSQSELFYLHYYFCCKLPHLG